MTRSISSRAAGTIPEAIMAETVFATSFRLENTASMVLFAGGLGISLTMISVIIPRVPSEPHKSLVRSKPVTFLSVFPPVLISSPSGRTNSIPMRESLVTPYFTAFGPPALRATFPPMVETSMLAGSGPYIRPNWAAFFCKSPLTTPGCTTAQRLALSTSRILFSLLRAIMIPPCLATDVPLRLVPAPRGMILIFSREAIFMILEISSRLPGSITASG